MFAIFLPIIFHPEENFEKLEFPGTISRKLSKTRKKPKGKINVGMHFPHFFGKFRKLIFFVEIGFTWKVIMLENNTIKKRKRKINEFEWGKAIEQSGFKSTKAAFVWKNAGVFSMHSGMPHDRNTQSEWVNEWKQLRWITSACPSGSSFHRKCRKEEFLWKQLSNNGETRASSNSNFEGKRKRWESLEIAHDRFGNLTSFPWWRYSHQGNRQCITIFKHFAVFHPQHTAHITQPIAVSCSIEVIP